MSNKVIIDTDPTSKKEPIRFHCWRCGACCQSIAGMDGFEELDDGTGTCIHFDRKSRNCLIYENRPFLCNVWAIYHALYENEMTEEEYSLLNIESCRGLRAALGLPEPEILLARKKARAARENNDAPQQRKINVGDSTSTKAADEGNSGESPQKPKKKSWLGFND